MEAIVRLEALDGVWETCGVDRLRGLHPQGIQPTWNDWGPDGLSFQLHRDPGAIYPDLSAFTPCEVEIGGRVIWDGRVRETPSDDNAISVQGLGWQYHLDDDTYERVYVHTRLTDWQDLRSYLGCRLDFCTQAGFVETGEGAIVFGWRANTSLVANLAAGVQLDLGPSNTAKRIVVEWESSNNSGAAFYCTAGDDDENVASADVLWNLANQGAAASGTNSATLTTARRYLALFLYTTGAGTPGTDIWQRIKAIRVFADTAYESGGRSVLKADMVWKDALDRATVLLSPDRSGIQAADFEIPELVLDGDRTPREVGQAVNAFHGWLQQIAVGRRPIFAPLPDAPLLEIGDWPGAEFADASTNSGDEIYSRVKVQGAGPAGTPLRVERSQGQQPGVPFEAISTPAPDNPSFDSNTASWTPSAGTFVRTTLQYDTAPASGHWTGHAAGSVLEETFTGTFKAGRTYLLELRMHTDAEAQAGFSDPIAGELVFGDIARGDVGVAQWAGRLAWTGFAIVWTPTADRISDGVSTKVKLHIKIAVEDPAVPSIGLWVDSLQLKEARPTLVDRRRFRRTKLLPVQAALPTLAAERLADISLSQHKSTPLKGTVAIAPGGARLVLGGAEIHPAHIGPNVGQLLRLTNRIDPDTGGVGRDGVMRSVTYDHDNEVATVAIDNDRRRLDQLIARYAAVVGAGR